MPWLIEHALVAIRAGGNKMFLGLFIVAAGVLSLLESLNVISANVKWGMPLAVICFGLHLIYEAVKSKKDNRDISNT